MWSLNSESNFNHDSSMKKHDVLKVLVTSSRMFKVQSSNLSARMTVQLRSCSPNLSMNSYRRPIVQPSLSVRRRTVYRGCNPVTMARASSQKEDESTVVSNRLDRDSREGPQSCQWFETTICLRLPCTFKRRSRTMNIKANLTMA